MSIANILSIGAAAGNAAVASDDAVNTLLSMNDDAVRSAIGDVFAVQMQTTPAVNAVFFPSSQHPAAPLPSGSVDWAGNVAAALVGWSLAHTSQHGFAQTATAATAQQYVNQQLTPGTAMFMTVARANYDALFPANCGVGQVKFQSFMGPDADALGKQLADRLVSVPFTVKQMLLLDADPAKFWRTLYLYIYMVGRLSPGNQQRVVAYWDEKTAGKGAKPSWDYYEYMLAGRYNEQTFLAEVVNAISVSKVTRTKTQVLGCQGGPAAHCTTTEVPSQYTYGIAVANWLNGRGDGWKTGAQPNNVENVSTGGGGCFCFTAGTPILMADGSSKPIEEVAFQEPLFGRDGIVVQRGRQDVVWDLEDGELLFGINELEPFFNASHPLLTSEGWKAMSPVAARRINPHLEIGKLKEGDVLYQVAGLSPFQYREVLIEQLTWLRPEPGRTVYSILLHRENHGYHAHGFCVAVNYPDLTEDSFSQAFARLSAAERTLIRSRLAPIMPLLRRSMGNFVEKVLMRSLRDPAESQ